MTIMLEIHENLLLTLAIVMLLAALMLICILYLTTREPEKEPWE